MASYELTPLKRISTDGGDVLHGIKSSSETFFGFGEAYFSIIRKQSIKGWKKHSRMTANLIVPIGLVKFVLFDDCGNFLAEMNIGHSNFARLTIRPNVWFAFMGISNPESLILNIANIEHDPSEMESAPLEQFKYRWPK